MNSGLSSIRCIIELQDNIHASVNLYVVTWNPHLRDSVNSLVDSRTTGLVIISTNQTGSYSIPPKGLVDTWDEMNSPRELETKMETYINASNLRDHLWFCNLTHLWN